MSTLTIPLCEGEIVEIEKLKIRLVEKTSNGVVRRMIDDHLLLRERLERLEDEIRNKDRQYDKLREVARGYFHSMHELMRESEFEQK